MIGERKIVEIYKNRLIRRNDDPGMIFYYSYQDFEGLQAEPVSFAGADGQTLRGAFYYYHKKSGERVVIFEHGLGGGHRSYMKEIEILARHGYTVLAYDHTGCMTSEGRDIGGLAQSVSDLDHCIRFLKGLDGYVKADISVIGHSWGGLSTLNIAALHHDVTHLAAISAPISVRALVRQFFRGPLSLYVPAVLRFEAERNPGYAELEAVKSLEKTQAKLLVIHSEDDPTVSCRKNFRALQKALAGRPETEFLLVTGKAHNPNYTVDAVMYKDQFFKELIEKQKKNEFTTEESKQAFKNSYDFDRMTAQDEAIWNKILAFLEQ